ncbi:MAG: CehA/McbA family metallohydrolase [Candidatus Acidiferrum sp.]
MLKRGLFFLAAISLAGLPVFAQRQPVLPQIDLPHPYYYRELYLPQLTSGPSSVAWSPDSKEVVYSMAGSLWRQKIDSTTARQLTDGPGYDYQPDWSPDGKSIVYVSFQKDALELHLLDLESGKSRQLTAGGAVNVEPRWSPDGKHIVFVSTSYHKRFHVFRADVNNGKLDNVVRLTGETKSDLPRYYYSPYDTEINPVWTRDGKEILFISNRGHIHGTGGFWEMKAEPGAEAHEIHYEETNWKARPDFSPDGSRMVYSSYLGGEWHNLWVMPANGGDAFPLTYNHWDSTNVRWSPDGKTLAFITNYGGAPATRIGFQSVPGGPLGDLKIEDRKYLNPRGTIELHVTDGHGNDLPARVSVTDESGRFWAPDSSWIHADDGFDPQKQQFEAHYFHLMTQAKLVVPGGKIKIDAMKGFEYTPVTELVEVRAGETKRVEIKLAPFENVLPDARNWISSDLHVHMNYGGLCQDTLERLAEQAKAEGLQVVNNLIVNKEQRFPDIASVGKNQENFSSGSVVIISGQEFHTSYWGHRGLLDMRGSLLLPGYAGYPNTAASSLYPMNADVYDMAHAHGALVGAVHPFDEVPDPFANPPQKIMDELPVDAALGKLDYMEIVGFSDHKSTATVWYRLLNLGYRIPAGAGTDATADYAAPIRGQVGFDRVYVHVPHLPPTVDSWKAALEQGRTFATNGPLLEFTLGGKNLGDELKFDTAQLAVPFTAKLRSIVPVNHFEVVCNGRVAATLKLEGTRDSAEVAGSVPLKESGWCVLRAFTDKAEYPVLDKYVYATTSPVYVTIGGKPPRSPEDAKYFAAWIGRTIDVTSHYPDWNSPAEKAYVLRRLREAKSIYENLAVPSP